VTYRADLEAEPWRHDFFAVMRRLERSFPQLPRISDSAARREDIVSLGQETYLDFPASAVGQAQTDAAGRMRLMVKFLGLLGPQGALPLANTEEAYHWLLERNDAFPRFLDLFTNRFLQLFYRAWADSRPIAQHERPQEDRFVAYLGSVAGIGSPALRGHGSIPDAAKASFAGLIGPQAKSASRLRGLLAGLFGVAVEIDQFVGCWLVFDADQRTTLGGPHARLGEAMLGASVYSVQDKFRVRITVPDLALYQRFLPSGDLCEPLADAVFTMMGEMLDYELELAIPAGATEPVRLGRAGQLGYTSWMAPNWSRADLTMRRDARFHPAERMQHKRRRTAAMATKEG
jgi:type VI secretion system protein ImpH